MVRRQWKRKYPASLKTQTYFNGLFSFQIKRPCYCYLKYVVNCITLRAATMSYVSALQTQIKRTRHSKHDISIHLFKKCSLPFSGIHLLNPTFGNTIAYFALSDAPSQSQAQECETGPGPAAEGAAQAQPGGVSSPGAL